VPGSPSSLVTQEEWNSASEMLRTYQAFEGDAESLVFVARDKNVYYLL
jgi:hypothetical protein